MQVDNALILKLERLARLQLSNEERNKIITDLNKILEMVEQLQEVDTSGTEPITHISDLQNVFRADTVKNQVSREAALQNAPAHDEVYFMLPKVLDLK